MALASARAPFPPLPAAGLRNARNEVRAQVHVRGRAQVAHELVDDDDRVDGVGHAEEQVERLALERVVGVLEAVDDGQLVLAGVARVVLQREDGALLRWGLRVLPPFPRPLPSRWTRGPLRLGT